MVKMIMELVRNQNFTLVTDDNKQSRLRFLKNSVPQESVLAPLLFNIYTYDLLFTISRNSACADDLALLQYFGNWKDLEGDFKPRHVYTFSVFPDLEIETFSH